MRSEGVVILLAWRNVWRNKRRTILTFLTIMIGCAMIILLNAISYGGHEQMIEDAVSLNAGHIQIHEKGFWDNRSLDYAMHFDPSFLQTLRSDRRVTGVSVRVQADALLSFEGNTAGVVVQAVDPDEEVKVTDLYRKIRPGGRFLSREDRLTMVLGETLAENLGAGVGSTISLISQGFDGSIAAEKLRVVGLFNSGNPEYDQSLVLMPLRQGKTTFSMGEYINSYTLKLASPGLMEDVRDSLRKRLGAGSWEVLGWDELMPELVQFIVMDEVSGYIFDFILFMIVAFGVLNTIQMSVYERIREMGIMLSIGTRPGQVVAMVLCESFFITLLGIVFGIALGVLTSYYFEVNPLNYSEYSREIAVWGVSTVVYPARTTLLNVASTGLITLLLSMLFSYFPARKASRLNPVEAVRHL